MEKCLQLLRATAGDFHAQPAELYVQLQQKYAKLKHPFAFRTKTCLFISLCLGILLPDVYPDVSSEHINNQKLKRIGMHFEAELFLNTSAGFRA